MSLSSVTPVEAMIPTESCRRNEVFPSDSEIKDVPTSVHRMHLHCISQFSSSVLIKSSFACGSSFSHSNWPLYCFWDRMDVLLHGQDTWIDFLVPELTGSLLQLCHVSRSDQLVYEHYVFLFGCMFLYFGNDYGSTFDRQKKILLGAFKSIEIQKNVDAHAQSSQLHSHSCRNLSGFWSAKTILHGRNSRS